MNRLSALLLSLVAVMGLLVIGCNKSVEPDEQAPAGVTNEEQAMKYFAQNDEFVANDEKTFFDLSAPPIDYSLIIISKADASVTPLGFGRSLTKLTRNVTVTILPGDSISVALVEKNITGTFNVRAVKPAGDTTTISKPFTDLSKRNVIFKRVSRDAKRYWLNWVPVASSLVEGGTAAPNNLLDITKIEFFLPDSSTISISDPQKYYMRYRWLRLYAGGQTDVPEYTGGQSVKLEVTLTSSQVDTDLVVLRYGFSTMSAHRARMALKSQINNGNGTFTRVYEVSRTMPLTMHFNPGYFQMGIDAMTKATVFDDAAAYAVSWWGIPYKVN